MSLAANHDESLANDSEAGAFPETKDLEGITDSFKVPSKRMGKSRQKKIAVLTSGGDSAGMNAAGKISFTLPWGHWLNQSQYERLCDRV